jgi:hypothetical protein
MVRAALSAKDYGNPRGESNHAIEMLELSR